MITLKIGVQYYAEILNYFIFSSAMHVPTIFVIVILKKKLTGKRKVIGKRKRKAEEIRQNTRP
jgi:hypothetical protein